MIWNVKGAKCKILYHNIQFLLMKHQSKMVALLETKVADTNNNRTFRLLSQTLPSHVMIPGTGDGGIWIY